MYGEEVRLVIHKKDRIDYILDGMADLYGVSRKDIYARRHNPDLARRKAIAIKLLVDVADCTLQEICDTFQTSSKQALSASYLRITDDISSLKEAKAEYTRVTNHLGL